VTKRVKHKTFIAHHMLFLERTKASVVAQSIVSICFFLCVHITNAYEHKALIFLIIGNLLFASSRSLHAIYFLKNYNKVKVKNQRIILAIHVLAMVSIWSSMTIYIITNFSPEHLLYTQIILSAAGSCAAAVATAGMWPALFYVYTAMFLGSLAGSFYIKLDLTFAIYNTFNIAVYYLTLHTLRKMTYRDSINNIISEETLRKKNDELQSLFDAIPADVSLIDQDGKYLYVNSHLTQNINIAADQIIGKEMGFKNPKDPLVTLVKEFKYSGNIEKVNELELTMPTGDKYWYLVSLKRLKNNNIIVISYNIDDHKNAIKEIDMQKTIVSQSARMASIGEMAGGIAHEINNPLSIIAGMNKILRKHFEQHQITAPATISCFDKVDKNISRIAGIIKSLRTVSRDGNLDPFNIESFKDVISDIVELVSDKYNRIGTSFRFTPPVEDFQIDCRRVQIEQVLINLLNNAADATADQTEPWVELKVEKNQTSLKISIIDSGKGIPEEIRNKLMTPFFTTKAPGKGTGLGLSISLNIIKQHNGKFYIDANHPNTCFVIELPLSQPISIKQSA
jgi:signal transduction histidine kinase